MKCVFKVRPFSFRRANAIMNVSTFVLFRILLLGWMTRWLTVHRDEVPLLFFTVGSLGLATIVGMNIVLFYRILVSDYLGKGSKDPASSDEHSDAPNDQCDQVSNDEQANGNLAKQVKAAVHRRQPHNMNRMVMSLFDEQEEVVRPNAKWD